MNESLGPAGFNSIDTSARRTPTAEQVDAARYWLEKQGRVIESGDAYDLAVQGGPPEESMSNYGVTRLSGEPDYFYDN